VRRAAILLWRGPWLAPLGIALGVWGIAGALSEWTTRIGPFASAAGDAGRRARGMPRSMHGTALAHVGVGLTLIARMSSEREVSRR
jgi:cytochrome c-type biogenesis protein CcmF